MKGFILFIGRFVVLLLCGTVLAGLLIFAHAVCVSYSVGRPAALPSAGVFLYALFFGSLVSVFFTPLILSFSVIRRRGFQTARIIAFILCVALVWFALLPGWAHLYRSYSSLITPPAGSPLSSAGYFREEAQGVLYYSSVRPNGRGDGVFIDISGLSGSSSSVQLLQDAPVHAGDTLPFSDLLIKQHSQAPLIFNLLYTLLHTLYRGGLEAVSGGWIAWLSFASLALAICALPCLGSVSAWRLNSIMLISFGALVVCACNALIIDPSLLSFWEGGGALTSFLSSAGMLGLVLVNLVFCVLFILAALIMSVVHRAGRELEVTE